MMILDCNVLCVRKVFGNIRGSMFNDLTQAMDELGVREYFNINNISMTMTYTPTGASIIFRGMNAGKQTDTLGGQRLGSFQFGKKKHNFLC